MLRSASSVGKIPLEAQLAGFSLPLTWRQQATGIASGISVTLLPTKARNLLGFLCSHPKVTLLSVQAKTLEDGTFRTFAT